jgi:hypothetical protein
LNAGHLRKKRLTRLSGSHEYWKKKEQQKPQWEKIFFHKDVE